MANKYAGTQTEKNLEAAFAGESQARNKYTYFASRAKKDGFEQIAALFQKTADNEKEHAKLWFKHLGGIGSTLENLNAAAAGEHPHATSTRPWRFTTQGSSSSCAATAPPASSCRPIRSKTPSSPTSAPRASSTTKSTPSDSEQKQTQFK